MRIALVANPYSGKKRGDARLPAVEARLTALGVDVDTLRTERHEHAYELIRDLDPRGYDGVVAMGGDGTNYQVLNALLRHHPEALPSLGILPGGSGNSFAKDLDIHGIDDGIEAIARNRPVPVDVCRYRQGEEERYFVNLLGVGFVTDVAETATRYKFAGDLSYVFGVGLRLVGLSFQQLEMDLDGRRISQCNCFVACCNSRLTGGDMLIAPEARIDDGLVDVVVCSALGRWSLLRALPRLFEGTHGEHPGVRMYRARRVRIETDPIKPLLPDGELSGHTPVEIEVLRHRVRYFR